MKKLILTSALLLTAIPLLPACSQNPSRVKTAASTLSSADQAAENKKIVIDFYEGVFQKHQVAVYADRYIGNQYIQHNPHVPDGKAPFVNYFTQYFKENPQAESVIKRAAADGDLVYLHVHSTQNADDRGTAVVDIFRLENGKIVEHWDVQQDVPADSTNHNTMF